MKDGFPMVILHLTAVETGGAADFTFNLHRSLLEEGYRSYVAVAGNKVITPEGVSIAINRSKKTLWVRFQRRLRRKYYLRHTPYINPKYAGHNMSERIMEANPEDLVKALPEAPDFILVHWVSGYANAKYVSRLQKQTRAKVFYMMVDEALLTGGCHYPWDCQGIANGCRNCPMVDSRVLRSAIRLNFLYKQAYLTKDRNVVLPTEFDRIRLEHSKLWKHAQWHKQLETIDENLFSPVTDKSVLKTLLGIPADKKVVFMGSANLNEKRKGMSVLVEAVPMVKHKDVVFLVAGRENVFSSLTNTVFIGHVDMVTLAKAYHAADVFVCPSLEDSGPQMLNMAVMSGVPAVAFPVGSALDLIKTGETGYLASFDSAADLAIGMDYLLDLSVSDYEKLSKNCRSLAMRLFSKKATMEFYNALFRGRGAKD